jgi:hypothetical protein
VVAGARMGRLLGALLMGLGFGEFVSAPRSVACGWRCWAGSCSTPPGPRRPMPACGRRCSAVEGRMVFLSSRVLSEVERIADRVGIICEGRLVDLLEVSALKTRALRRFELHFARPVPPAAFDRLPGGSWSRSRGDMVRCAVEGSIDALIKAAASHELVSLVSHGRTWRRSSWPPPPGIAGFLVNSLSALAEGLKQWRPLTLFYQYAGNDPLRNGLDVGDAAVLLAVAAAMALVALVAFQRRDLAA